MIVAVAGPYSADTPEKKQANLLVLNKIAAQLLELGHLPIIGVNAALPVVEQAKTVNVYESIMNISMAVMKCCDALYFVAESKGANQERDWFFANRLPVFYSIEELQNYSSTNQ